jgi:hypothetical protein
MYEGWRVAAKYVKDYEDHGDYRTPIYDYKMGTFTSFSGLSESGIAVIVLDDGTIYETNIKNVSFLHPLMGDVAESHRKNLLRERAALAALPAVIASDMQVYLASGGRGGHTAEEVAEECLAYADALVARLREGE